MESKEAIWYEQRLDMEMAQFTCYFGKMISEERWLFMCGTQRSFTSFATDEFTFPNSTDKCKRTAKTKKKSLLWPHQNNHPATLLLQKCAIWMPSWSHLKVLLSAPLWTCPYNTPILFSLLFVFLCVDKSITYITPLEEKKQHISVLCAVPSDSGKELGCK